MAPVKKYQTAKEKREAKRAKNRRSYAKSVTFGKQLFLFACSELCSLHSHRHAEHHRTRCLQNYHRKKAGNACLESVTRNPPEVMSVGRAVPRRVQPLVPIPVVFSAMSKVFKDSTSKRRADNRLTPVYCALLKAMDRALHASSYAPLLHIVEDRSRNKAEDRYFI